MVRRAALLMILFLIALGMAGDWPSQDLRPGGGDQAKAAENLYLQVADLVETRGYEKPPGQDLLSDSLDGMLHSLDPHSNYYSPQTFKDLMEDQEGKFSGLGMLVAKPSATSPLLVVNPIPDTPAWRAGIRAGDVILEVDGQPTDKMSSRDAVRKLKGPDGTLVTIKVGRGSAPPEVMTLKRAPIPKHTVPYAFMLKDGEGYVKINTFGQTTADELAENLDRLRDEGMTSLILDLRDNPGGALKAAVDVASMFLSRGQEVVSIRGRYAGVVRRYVAYKDGAYSKIPMVVLIDLGSASASEIVTGALQDHDRAEVVGVRSWGKGLVQTLTPLDNDGAVAITTARYYTPSGRLIQRDYSHSYDAYYFPDEQPKGVDEPVEPKPEAHTDNGRPVYGGGGIAPDVKVEAMEIPALAQRLERQRAFLEFAAKEAEQGHLDAARAESPEMLDAFKAYLAQQKITYTPDEWKASEAYVRCALGREAMTMLEGQAAGYRAMIPMDVQLQKAEQILQTMTQQKKAA